MFGADVTWRAFRAATFQLQLAIDDLQYEDRSAPETYPDRWALTLSAFGPLGRRLSWRALYTQASTLAFRTTDPFEAYVDDSVGIGRGVPDMDHLMVSVTLPVHARWAVTPDLAIQRQGAARLTTPFPVDPADIAATPQFLSAPVETTLRAGVSVSGRAGPLDLLANAGVHHRTNADNVEGVSATRVEGPPAGDAGPARPRPPRLASSQGAPTMHLLRHRRLLIWRACSPPPRSCPAAPPRPRPSSCRRRRPPRWRPRSSSSATRANRRKTITCWPP